IAGRARPFEAECRPFPVSWVGRAGERRAPRCEHRPSYGVSGVAGAPGTPVMTPRHWGSFRRPAPERRFRARVARTPHKGELSMKNNLKWRIAAMPIAVACIGIPAVACDSLGSNPLDTVCCKEFTAGADLTGIDWGIKGTAGVSFGAFMQ